MIESAASVRPEIETASSPERFKHIVMRDPDVVQDLYVVREALCGEIVFGPAAARNLIECPRCRAVFDDDEAIVMAARAAGADI